MTFREICFEILQESQPKGLSIVLCASDTASKNVFPRVYRVVSSARFENSDLCGYIKKRSIT